MRDFGKSAIFCSPWFPRRWRQVTHLEINCLTIAFPLTIQYPLARSSFKVIPRLPWCVLSCTWPMINEVMWLDFGRMIGFFRVTDRLALRILPPTLMIPSLSRTGSNERRELAFLNRAFFFLSYLRLSFLDFAWMVWRLLISDGNAPLCTCFKISTSASFKSTTLSPELMDVPLIGLSSEAPSLGAFFFVPLSFYLYLRQSATAIFTLCQLENRWSLLRISLFSFTALALTLKSLTSRESASTCSS